mmetsp:Transcript_34212/g.82134  ORF Transcript_34212/g.82134 Transcript_34212/m.82134 type:complete len:128 (+) Transcript_34212:1398-1781(+)
MSCAAGGNGSQRPGLESMRRCAQRTSKYVTKTHRAMVARLVSSLAISPKSDRSFTGFSWTDGQCPSGSQMQTVLERDEVEPELLSAMGAAMGAEGFRNRELHIAGAVLQAGNGKPANFYGFTLRTET